MGRPVLLRLQRKVVAQTVERALDPIGLVSDHGDRALWPQGTRRVQHVGDHRLAGHRVQQLHPLGAHARPLAGGEHQYDQGSALTGHG